MPNVTNTSAPLTRPPRPARLLIAGILLLVLGGLFVVAGIIVVVGTAIDLAAGRYTPRFPDLLFAAAVVVGGPIHILGAVAVLRGRRFSLALAACGLGLFYVLSITATSFLSSPLEGGAPNVYSLGLAAVLALPYAAILWALLTSRDSFAPAAPRVEG